MTRTLTYLCVIFLGFYTYTLSRSVDLPTSPTALPPIHHECSDCITIGWVGDMVPAADPLYNRNVLTALVPYLENPDLMIGNLEGTFADGTRDSKCLYLHSMCYAFRGDSSFATTLKNAGFDFVSLINNHSYDFGQDGLTDTETVLENTNLPFLSPTAPATSITIKGFHIGILGLSSTQPYTTLTDYDFVRSQIATLKKTNDFVIVIFHGGAEGSDKTIVPNMHEYMGDEDRGNVSELAHLSVDAGANLVLGSGPHVLRKIEMYNGVPIAYSLGNFVGGNESLITKGTLGISGIFTATLQKDAPTTYDFTSVTLSKNGIPTLDPLDQGKQLIESL